MYQQVHNLSVSLSDGRALCYTLHHYHPHLLPLHHVKHVTTQSLQHNVVSARRSGSSIDVMMNKCSSIDVMINKCSSIDTMMNKCWSIDAITKNKCWSIDAMIIVFASLIGMIAPLSCTVVPLIGMIASLSCAVAPLIGVIAPLIDVISPLCCTVARNIQTHYYCHSLKYV